VHRMSRSYKGLANAPAGVVPRFTSAPYIAYINASRRLLERLLIEIMLPLRHRPRSIYTMTSSPPVPNSVGRNSSATALSRPTVKLIIAQGARCSCPTGGSFAYVDQGNTLAHAMRSRCGLKMTEDTDVPWRVNFPYQRHIPLNKLLERPILENDVRREHRFGAAE